MSRLALVVLGIFSALLGTGAGYLLFGELNQTQTQLRKANRKIAALRTMVQDNEAALQDTRAELRFRREFILSLPRRLRRSFRKQVVVSQESPPPRPQEKGDDHDRPPPDPKPEPEPPPPEPEPDEPQICVPFTEFCV